MEPVRRQDLRNYQTILILKPDLDEPNVDQSLEKISALIQKHGGEVLKIERWGKKRLAYKVKKSKFGYYLNIYHSGETSRMSELEKDFQLYDLVIKYLIIRLSDKDLERVMSKQEETAKGAAGEEKKSGDSAPAVAADKKEDKAN
ncbi:MAG: 30S ribosomal protein S6 [Nitrospina sp.]|nr:MAG: 30S ribosomal protein S6 [Nitrospina sp.]TDJ57339.1 MAG: 30S ribosomal protein S6 [Nitrospina sp.]